MIGQRLCCVGVGVGGVTGPVRAGVGDVGACRPGECAVHASGVCGTCDTTVRWVVRILWVRILAFSLGED